MIGDDVNENVGNEYRRALANGLHIITLIKTKEKKIPEETTRKLRAISWYTYEKDCSVFYTSEDLYKAIKNRLGLYIREVWKRKIRILRNRNEVYDVSATMIAEAKRRVVLCQKTSTLILGPKDGTNESKLYTSLHNWIQSIKNPIQFVHVFSETATREAVNLRVYSQSQEAKNKLLTLMQNYQDSTVQQDKVKLVFKTASDVQSCLAVDDSMLVEMCPRIGMPYYLYIPGALFEAKEAQAVITDLEANSGTYFCSSEDPKYAEKCLKSIYKRTRGV